jgi:hypothetical protein
MLEIASIRSPIALTARITSGSFRGVPSLSDERRSLCSPAFAWTDQTFGKARRESRPVRPFHERKHHVEHCCSACAKEAPSIYLIGLL